MKDKFYLLISFWNINDQERKKELLFCLKKNIENHYIEKIYIFWEKEPDLKNSLFINKKIENINFFDYPTYNKFIDYANLKLSGKKIIIANSDIFFDNSLKLLLNYNLTNKVLALTRYNLEKYIANNGGVWERSSNSQDAWIFQSPLNFDKNKFPVIKLGYFGCDVWFAYELEKIGKIVLNPSEDIKTWHVHKNCKVISNPIEQLCKTAEFYTNGWVKTVLNKIPLVIKAIDSTCENGFFIFSDVDVQFFSPIQEEIRKILAKNPRTDIFFQQDAVRDLSGIPYFCTGFFVCRANLRTRRFWQLVGKRMESENKGDQECVNYLWKNNCISGLKLDFLPLNFWASNSGIANPKIWDLGDNLEVLPNALMHHANWTVGVANKIKQLNYVREKIKQEQININRITNKNFKQKLPGSCWGITTFYNLSDYKIKYKNYKIFRENSKKQGLKLLAVEITFNKKPFELKKSDAEIIIQIRASKKNIMWQKEALLNIGLKNLPKDCDKIAWLDCDVVFENNNWVKETSKLLEKYCVVQPFSLVVILDKNKSSKDVNISNIKFGVISENTKRHSFVYLKNLFDNRIGHPGFAWAGRREIFDKIKFYDKFILASGDTFMAYAFYSQKSTMSITQNTNMQIEDFSSWQEKCFNLVAGNVFYTNGVVFHLWHGKTKNRRYEEIRFILKENNFNPLKDVIKDHQGLLQWSCDKRNLIKNTKKYFYLRNEDDCFYLRDIFDIFFIFTSGFSFQNIINIINIKKDRFFGRIGRIIKSLSPNLYNFLVRKKPKWAEPLDM